MLPPAIGASVFKLVPALVLATAAFHPVTSGIYQLTAATAWERITGWVGIVLGVLAVYAALAALLDSVLKRTVLPLGWASQGTAGGRGRPHRAAHRPHARARRSFAAVTRDLRAVLA